MNMQVNYYFHTHDHFSASLVISCRLDPTCPKPEKSMKDLYPRKYRRRLCLSNSSPSQFTFCPQNLLLTGQVPHLEVTILSDLVVLHSKLLLAWKGMPRYGPLLHQAHFACSDSVANLDQCKSLS